MCVSTIKAGLGRVTTKAIVGGLLLFPSACINSPYAMPVTRSIQLASPTGDGKSLAGPTTVPFVLDGGRMYTEVVFRRLDGSSRKALVWINFGIGGMSLSPALRAELGNGTVEFELGKAAVRVGAEAILPSDGDTFAQLGPLPVEAILPAGMWPLFGVTLDYPARTLTLGPPETTPATGIAVPMNVNRATGVASVHIMVDGQTLPVALDPGGGFTWIHGSDVRKWLRSNPGWYRADGALGASNQAMVAENVEQLGTVVRVPRMQLGALTLADVGVLGTGPAKGHPIDQFKESMLWTIWGKGAAEPVVGWIGANALRPYRVTFDYHNQQSYWERTGAPQFQELDAVGVSLIKGTKYYRIGSIVTRHGKAELSGAEVGDRLIDIDGQSASVMSREAIMQALRGAPGTRHTLTLDRKGEVITIEAPVIGEAPTVQPYLSTPASYPRK